MSFIGEAIGLFVLIFTSLVGIFTLVRLLAEKLLDGAPEEEVISILPVKGHEERVEYLLRALSEKARHKIIVADFGMDEETREIVLRMKAEFQNFNLLDENELDDYIGSLSREKADGV